MWRKGKLCVWRSSRHKVTQMRIDSLAQLV